MRAQLDKYTRCYNYQYVSFCTVFLHRGCTRCSSGDRKDWDDAQADCKTKGGTLVHLRDSDEHDWVKDKRDGDRLWIGCVDNGSKGWQWVNADGSKVGCCTRGVNGEDCVAEYVVYLLPFYICVS